MNQGTRVAPKVAQNAPVDVLMIFVDCTWFEGEERWGVPNVPKTTKGKVFPMIHSPIEPMIMRRPPKKKNTPGGVDVSAL